MKKTFLFFLLFSIASITVLNSCQDVDEPVEPDPIVCTMTASTQENVETTYEYNNDGNLFLAVTNSDSTQFYYEGGKLKKATTGKTASDFVYGTGSIPTKVNLTEDGKATGHITMESENNEITGIEYFDLEGNSVSKTEVSYDADNNITSIEVSEYDPNTMMLIPSLTITDMTADGKTNPFHGNFALIYANIDKTTPVIFGKSNILTGKVVYFGNELPATGIHTYNEHDLPLTSTVGVQGFGFNHTYTYTCE